MSNALYTAIINDLLAMGDWMSESVACTTEEVIAETATGCGYTIEQVRGAYKEYRTRMATEINY